MAIAEAEDLVCYAWEDNVVGVKEFQLGEVLREGRCELLSQEVPSQDGPLHLFDLCLRFGRYDTAWAMAQRGVAGCVLQNCHLQGLLWDKRRPQDLHDLSGPCRCVNEETCCICSFGFPVADGLWMDDWDSKLDFAVAEAQRVTARCLLQELLKAVACGGALLSAVSEKVKARLLDLAILTGNKEAASCLARVCKLRPLRRWRVEDLFHMEWDLIVLDDPDVLLAALSAGMDLTELWWDGGHGELPFREAVALSGHWSDFAELLPPPPRRWTPPPEKEVKICFASQRTALSWNILLAALTAGIDLTKLWWQGSCSMPFREAVALSGRWSDFAELLPPPPRPWAPPPENDLGWYLIGGGKICAERLRSAAAAGVALKDFRWGGKSLLDRAILRGQEDCAALCAAAGVEILKVQKNDLQMEGLLWASASAQERQAAAEAAAREALAMNWRRQCEKGVAIFQVMKANMCRRSFPVDFVDEVLLYATDVPLTVTQLDLWDVAKDWRASISTKPPPQTTPSDIITDGSKAEVHIASEPTEVTSQGQPSGSQETHAADADGSKASEEAVPDDLLRAIQESRAEAPPLWSRDGVRLYRLTRSVKAKHVVELLFDENGPLKELHDRVRDFGCEVDPEGNPVKILFVPCTNEQIDELHQIAQNNGLELSRWKHILALEKDEAMIAAALGSLSVPSSKRPELRPVKWPMPAEHAAMPEAQAAPEEHEDEDGDGPMIVPEMGFQTDSSAGYPAYQG